MDKESLEIYKSKLIELLKLYIHICKVNGLQYFCCGGTAIGAVRHHGMIPWDDDIDVFMPRSDYDRFLEIVEREYSGKVDLLTPDRTTDYYLPFTKMCDKNSTILEFAELPCVFGVFLDIFPLDGAPNSLSQQKMVLRRFQKDANKLKSISKRPIDNFLFFFKRLFSFQLITATNEIIYMFFKDFQRKRVLKALDDIMRENCYEKSEYVCNYGGMWGVREFAKKEWFNSSVFFEFENLSVSLPVGYDSYLKNLYGDYMQPPPIDKQVSHHHVAFIDLDRRWTIEEVLRFVKLK